MDWEEYWKFKKEKKRPLYDLIASFYRCYIINRSLEYFIKKYAQPNALLLHTGCGSGEVDKDLVKKYRLIACDISQNALKINNVDKNKVRADIFNLPFKDKTFDILYNLGVLEHFYKEEILKMLPEFKRVTKKNGYIIIFIPPEFGLSVIFFKALKFIIKKVFKKTPVFHPEEPSRLKSKKEAIDFLTASDLKLKEYYFGIKDLFTYSVIVAEND